MQQNKLTETERAQLVQRAKEAAKQFDDLVKAGIIPNFNTPVKPSLCEDRPQCKT